MRKEITSFRAEVDTPITLEHVERTPVTFPNKKALAAYCKEHHLQSGALL